MEFNDLHSNNLDRDGQAVNLTLSLNTYIKGEASRFEQTTQMFVKYAGKIYRINS